MLHNVLRPSSPYITRPRRAAMLVSPTNTFSTRLTSHISVSLPLKSPYICPSTPLCPSPSLPRCHTIIIDIHPDSLPLHRRDRMPRLNCPYAAHARDGDLDLDRDHSRHQRRHQRRQCARVLCLKLPLQYPHPTAKTVIMSALSSSHCYPMSSPSLVIAVKASKCPQIPLITPAPLVTSTHPQIATVHMSRRRSHRARRRDSPHAHQYRPNTYRPSLFSFYPSLFHHSIIYYWFQHPLFGSIALAKKLYHHTRELRR